MSEFFIGKGTLWQEAVETAETLKFRIGNLERCKDPLTPGEKKAVSAMKRKLNSFIVYGKAARGDLTKGGLK